MNIETMKQVIEKLKVAMTDARQDESHFESWMILNEAICNSIDDLRAAIEQAKRQEPVAWMVVNGEGKIEQTSHYMPECERWLKYDATRRLVPLYTAPPQRSWQGLTDEEVSQLIPNYVGDSSEIDLYWLTTEIEAKLKEKNT